MIDLHIHTDCSDGTDDVKGLLELAEKKGLEVISISDHNTVSAYDILPSCRDSFSGKIITGIEITTSFDGMVVELLGYGIDTEMMKKELLQCMVRGEEKQNRLRNLLISAFDRAGVKYEQSDVDKSRVVSTSFKAFTQNEENIKLLLDPAAAKGSEYFCRMELYNPSSKLFIDMGTLYPSFQQTIDIIHRCGGLAFLAHTFAYFPTIEDKLEDIIKRHNIDGFETRYTVFTDEQTQFMLDFCKSNNKHMSCGSDYHGGTKPSFNLATGFGNLKMELSHVASWINKVKTI